MPQSLSKVYVHLVFTKICNNWKCPILFCTLTIGIWVVCQFMDSYIYKNLGFLLLGIGLLSLIISMMYLLVKKRFLHAFLTGFSFIVALVVPAFLFLSPIDLRGTMATKYHRIERTTDKIIETQYFTLTAPKNWVHLFGGYGMEGDPVGAFFTKNGIISYEYGRFGPSYERDDTIEEYKVEHQTINRFQVNIARSLNGETGICIPAQHEMETNFTIYMDKSVTDNFEELVTAISELKFK